MAKKPKLRDESPDSSLESVTLLSEFVRMFETIPQKYCLFCEANSLLGVEAHKAECPFRRALKLLSSIDQRQDPFRNTQCWHRCARQISSQQVFRERESIEEASFLGASRREHHTGSLGS